MVSQVETISVSFRDAAALVRLMVIPTDEVNRIAKVIPP